MTAYGIGNTEMIKIPKHNIFLKMEKHNKNHSIKDRVAYFVIKDILQKGIYYKNITFVESSSGNLGVSLDYFMKLIDAKFIVLIDETIASSKFKRIKNNHIDYIKVPLHQYPDYRTARIERAKRLGQEKNYFWTNQYNNINNLEAHYKTTAPEIWQQMNGDIDFFIASVGTGGTICGVGKYLKEKNKNIQVYGVEPQGSTIFGGEYFEYINVGVGLKGKSDLIEKYGNLIDRGFKVSDATAINLTKKHQDIGFGISTAYSLFIALKLSKTYPDKNIVMIAADGIENYRDILLNYGH